MPISSELASVIGAGMQSGGGLLSTLLTNRSQRKLAEYSYAKDYEMWQKANEYNAPSSQMKRLKEAGLNPNMIYGSGHATGNTTQQIPKYQMPRLNVPDVKTPVLEMLETYQNLQIKKAQTELVRQNVISQQITNSYLDKTLQGKSAYEFSRGIKGGLDIGLRGVTASDEFGLSPYFSKISGEARLKQTNAQLKFEELQLRKKGISYQDSLIWRMMVQSGMFDVATDYFNELMKRKN